MAAASAPAAGGSSRSRKATAGCAGCRPASPPGAGAGSPPEDFTAAGYWQLSLAGMSRLGSTGPARQALPDGPAPPAAAPGWTQLQLSAPGESLHFDKRHWAASAITGPALQQARHIAAGLAEARGWNDRIITETGRALAVVLAEYQPGDMIAWSQLPAALHRRDLSITRTAEILAARRAPGR